MTQENDKIFKLKEKHLKGGGYIALTIIGFVFAVYLINFRYGISSSNNDWGTFGDYFGGVLNPILSFLAFIALLYTIKIQQDALSITHKELELTRDDLTLTRLEMEKSSKALGEQSKSLTLQNFENRFFNLIHSHKLTVSNFHLPRTLSQHKLEEKGRPCFGTYYNNFRSEFIKSAIKDPLEKLTHAVKLTITRHDFSYYLYEHVDAIDVLLIEKEKLESKEYKLYSNIIKRQYSKYELFFLYFFHYSLLNSAYKDFLKETKFFEQLEHTLILIRSPKILKLYGKEVFGNKINDPLFAAEFEE